MAGPGVLRSVLAMAAAAAALVGLAALLVGLEELPAGRLSPRLAPVGGGAGERDVAPVAPSPARLVRMHPSLMEAALARGDVDAFAAWEPYCTRASLSGTARALAWSRDLWPGHPCCVLAARTGFLAAHPGAGAALVRAHRRATAFIAERPGEAAGLFARETGMEEAVAAQALAKLPLSTELDREGLEGYVEAIRAEGLVPAGTDPAAAVGAVLAPPQGGAPLAGRLAVRVGWLGGDLHQAAFVVARENGFFSDEGLEVEPVSFENGAREMDAFASGDIDAGYLGAAPLLLKATVAGVPVAVLAGVNEEGSCIAVRALGPVVRPSDLAGRDVAVPGFGTVQHVLVLKALRGAGVAVEGGT